MLASRQLFDITRLTTVIGPTTLACASARPRTLATHVPTNSAIALCEGGASAAHEPRPH